MGRSMRVLIIGAGPAGLAAAIAARKKGFNVTVADGAKPLIDKACGEGLLPDTVAALRQLGIGIQAGDGQSFQHIRFIDGTTFAESKFPGEGGIGVRRIVLHRKLVEHAEECGVELLRGAPVTRLFSDGAVVGTRLVEAKWIVGADGIHSRVRRWSGLDRGACREIRFAQRRHYRKNLCTNRVEIYWGRKVQAYVTPLANEETCVVLISRNSSMCFDEGLREFPTLAESLADAELSSVQRGAVTAMCKLKHVYRGNIALTGDASGSVDAITGEGLGLSFRQAIALADSLATGDLRKYQLAHRQLARRPEAMARLLLLLDRYKPLRWCVLREMAKDPEVFARMLTADVTETSSTFRAATGARFGWRLITASLWEKVQRLGRDLDIACINAGIAVGGRFTETDLDEELNMVQLNCAIASDSPRFPSCTKGSEQKRITLRRL